MRTKRGIKDSASSLLGRGWLRDRWLQRKVQHLERRYALELARSPRSIPVPAPRPTVPRPPLRRLLMIADFVWEEDELVPELQKICPVERLDLRPSLNAEPAARAVEAAVGEFASSHRNYEPDVVLLYGRSRLLSEELFTRLRGLWRCPILGMNLDEKTEFLDYGVFSRASDNYQHWAQYFDLNLCNVRAIADWYADRGLPVHYMAEGYHPRFPEPRDEFQHELTFVGTARPERTLFLQRLAGLGVRATALGKGWPGSEVVKDPGQVYRVSQMNLGIGYACPSLNLTTLKARDFECPGSGGCYLTTWNWELALHFDIGREILCYRNEEELAEIFSYYRRRPLECRKIALAAWKRCLAEHTWEKRFRQIFREVGFQV